MVWLKKLNSYIQVLFGLTVAEKLFFIEAWLQALWVIIILRSPFRLRLFASSEPISNPNLGKVDLPHLLSLVDLAGSCHLKSLTCLERTLTAHRMLRRRGVVTHVCIGVRKELGDQLDAHAWLEHPDLPLEALNAEYSVLEPSQKIVCEP